MSPEESEPILLNSTWVETLRTLWSLPCGLRLLRRLDLGQAGFHCATQFEDMQELALAPHVLLDLADSLSLCGQPVHNARSVETNCRSVYTLSRSCYKCLSTVDKQVALMVDRGRASENSAQYDRRAASVDRRMQDRYVALPVHWQISGEDVAMYSVAYLQQQLARRISGLRSARGLFDKYRRCPDCLAGLEISH
jgi:hypothetical protein